MDLVELGARSMDLMDLEFLELECLAGKKWSGAVLLNLELLGALPNTPLMGLEASKMCDFFIFIFVLRFFKKYV
jgi:hypothetical protein